MRLPGCRSRRTLKTAALVVAVVVFVVGIAAAVDSSSSDGVFIRDALLLIARGALPLLGLMAFGLRWGDWRPSGNPLEVERERRLRDSDRSSPAATSSRPFDTSLDEDFDDLARTALAEELPEPLALALLHDVALVFADGGPELGLGVHWQPSAPHPAGGPSTGARVVVYRDSLRERYGHDLALLRAEIVRAVRESLAHHVDLDALSR